MEMILPPKAGIRTYLELMARLLGTDATIYPQIRQSGRSPVYCLANVLFLGLFYGLSALYYSRQILSATGTASPASFNPLAVVMTGICAAFFMHAGAALFVWVFCRGMGGNQDFQRPYFNLGIAAISLWPLAPALPALQAGQAHGGMIFWAIASAMYGAVVLYKAVGEASGLSRLKMAAAATATVVYVGCFLYLWL